MGLAPHTTHVPGYVMAYASNVYIFIYLFFAMILLNLRTKNPYPSNYDLFDFIG